MKRGVVINDDFMNYHDYDTENVRVINTFSRRLTFLMDNIKSDISYCDYIKDPMDSKNVEFIETVKMDL